MMAKVVGKLRSLSPEQILLGGTIVLLAWAPLPFGSNRLWSMSLLSIWSAILLAGLSIDAWRTNRRFALPSQLTMSAGFFGFVIAWAFIQWTTWTPGFLHHPVWTLAAETLGAELQGRISVNPASTLHATVTLAGYGALFWVAFNLSRKPGHAFTIVKAVALIAGIYAWYGLAVFVSGNESVLLYQKWEYPGALTSTFVNANNFATYAGIGLVCASALILRGIRPVLRSPTRTRVKVVQATEIALSGHGIYVFVAFGTFAALMLTGSRAGISSAFVALFLLLFLMLRSRRMSRGRLVRVGGAALVMLLLAALPLSGLVTERLTRPDTALTENARFDVYRLTVTAISDTPLLGTGYGTFADVFPSYRDSTVFTPSYWRKAHSTYLETVLELGIPAGLALIIAVAWVVWLCFTDALRRKRYRALPASATAAAVLAGLHSSIDFGLQIPAIAATLSALLGASIGWCTELDDAKTRQNPKSRIDKDVSAMGAGPPTRQ
ncbi:MAG: O-antigen ligase family protein [Parvibaculaceae bacterium]